MNKKTLKEKLNDLLLINIEFELSNVFTSNSFLLNDYEDLRQTSISNFKISLSENFKLGTITEERYRKLSQTVNSLDKKENDDDLEVMALGLVIITEPFKERYGIAFGDMRYKKIDLLSELKSELYSYFESYVEEGLEDPQEIVHLIYLELKDEVEGITESDLLRMIIAYENEKGNRNQEEDKKIKREEVISILEKDLTVSAISKNNLYDRIDYSLIIKWIEKRP